MLLDSKCCPRQVWKTIVRQRRTLGQRGFLSAKQWILCRGGCSGWSVVCRGGCSGCGGLAVHPSRDRCRASHLATFIQGTLLQGRLVKRRRAHPGNTWLWLAWLWFSIHSIPGFGLPTACGKMSCSSSSYEPNRNSKHNNVTTAGNVMVISSNIRFTNQGTWARQEQQVSQSPRIARAVYIYIYKDIYV